MNSVQDIVCEFCRLRHEIMTGKAERCAYQSCGKTDICDELKEVMEKYKNEA